MLIGERVRQQQDGRHGAGARHGALHPSRRNRNKRLPHSKRLDKKRHQVENLLARLKDGRRIATRHDCCAPIFLSAVLLAVTVIFR